MLCGREEEREAGRRRRLTPVCPCVTGHRLQKGLRDTSVAQHTPFNSVFGGRHAMAVSLNPKLPWRKDAL